jgi:hypothetical protein
VEKRNINLASLPTANSLTYSGASQQLTTAGTIVANSGTQLQYSVATYTYTTPSGPETAGTPSAYGAGAAAHSATLAGKYDVYVKALVTTGNELDAAGNLFKDNYKDSLYVSPITATIQPKGLTLTIDDQTLQDTYSASTPPQRITITGIQTVDNTAPYTNVFSTYPTIKFSGNTPTRPWTAANIGSYLSAIEFDTYPILAYNTNGYSNYAITNTPLSSVTGNLTISGDPYLNGTVAIMFSDGTAPSSSSPVVIDSMLVADTSSITNKSPNTDVYTFKWYVNGVLVKTSAGNDDNTYKVTVADALQEIVVVVSATNHSEDNGSLYGWPYAQAGPVEKKTPPTTPAAPVKSDSTLTAIKLVDDGADYEYKITSPSPIPVAGTGTSSADYNAESEFTGLTAGTAYTFVRRLKETAEYKPSADSPPTTISTLSQDQADVDEIKRQLLLVPAFNAIDYEASTASAAESKLNDLLATMVSNAKTNGQIASTSPVTATVVSATGVFIRSSNGVDGSYVADVTVTTGSGIASETVTISAVELKIEYRAYTVTLNYVGTSGYVDTTAATAQSQNYQPQSVNLMNKFMFGDTVEIAAFAKYGQILRYWTVTPASILPGSPALVNPTLATYPLHGDTLLHTDTLGFRMPSSNVTISVAFVPDPVRVDSDIINRVKELISGLVWETTQPLAPTVTAARSLVSQQIRELGSLLEGCKWYVNTISFTPATSGTDAIPDGIAGTYKFTVMIFGPLGQAPMDETVTLTMTIKPNPYVQPYAKAPVIYSQPRDAELPVSETAYLSVGALSPDGGTLTYQWYKATTKKYDAFGNVLITGSELIPGATSNTYEATNDEVGYYYYYVVITNKIKNGDTEPTVSVYATLNYYYRESLPNIKRQVYVYATTEATVSCNYGSHWVMSSTDFTFTVTADATHELSGLAVTTGTWRDDTPGYIEIRLFTADGTAWTPASQYKAKIAVVTVKRINETVSITLSGFGDDVGNAYIGSGTLRVWAVNGVLNVAGLDEGQRYSLYNIAGVQLSAGVSSGKTLQLNVPSKGIYLLKTEKGVVKSVVR